MAPLHTYNVVKSSLTFTPLQAITNYNYSVYSLSLKNTRSIYSPSPHIDKNLLFFHLPILYLFSPPHTAPKIFVHTYLYPRMHDCAPFLNFIPAHIHTHAHSTAEKKSSACTKIETTINQSEPPPPPEIHTLMYSGAPQPPHCIEQSNPENRERKPLVIESRVYIFVVHTRCIYTGRKRASELGSQVQGQLLKNPVSLRRCSECVSVVYACMCLVARSGI